MNNTPLESTTRWLDGSDMPQEAIDHIAKKIRLAYLPLAALLMLFAAVATAVIISEWFSIPHFWDDPGQGVCGFIAIVLIWLACIVFLRGGIRHLRFLKRREFVWIEGYTGGIYHTPGRGNNGICVLVRTDSSAEMTKTFSLSGANWGFKEEGIPVYAAMFNLYGREFFKGGFLRDPLVFKKNR